MRQFQTLIFMGNRDAEAKIKKLHEIFEGAIIMVGGLQQIPTTDPMYAAGYREAEDAVKDIAVALLGRNIKIGGLVSYP